MGGGGGGGDLPNETAKPEASCQNQDASCSKVIIAESHGLSPSCK